MRKNPTPLGGGEGEPPEEGGGEGATAGEVSAYVARRGLGW